MKVEEYEALIQEHPELKDDLHIVKGSSWRKDFVRVKPYWYKKPKLGNKKAMLALAKSAFNSYGAKGFVLEKDGVLPVIASINRRNLKGKQFVRRLTPFEKVQRLLALRQKLETLQG